MEGSLAEADGLGFPDKKSSQFELPSVGPDDELAEAFETGGVCARSISQQNKRSHYVKDIMICHNASFTRHTHQKVEDSAVEGQNQH